MVDAFDWAAWRAEAQPVYLEALQKLIGDKAKESAATFGVVFKEQDPYLSRGLTEYVGERIKEMEAATRARVSALIRTSMADGDDLSVEGLGGRIRDSIREEFAGYADWRADRIARAETAIAFNTGDLLGWKAAGVTQVVVHDGDCDRCKEADEKTWDIDYAMEHPIEHPGCVRSFSPVESSVKLTAEDPQDVADARRSIAGLPHQFASGDTNGQEDSARNPLLPRALKDIIDSDELIDAVQEWSFDNYGELGLGEVAGLPTKMMWVDISKVDSSQTTVSRQTLLKYVESGSPSNVDGLAVTNGSRYLMIDGNHRVTAKQLLGRTRVRLQVVQD